MPFLRQCLIYSSYSDCHSNWHRPTAEFFLCLFEFLPKRKTLFSLIRFIWRSVSFSLCVCEWTLHSIDFDMCNILKLPFIAAADTDTNDSCLCRCVCLTIATDNEHFVFFLFHFCSFARQSWFWNTTSDETWVFSLNDFVLYGTLINHILCEAIRPPAQDTTSMSI